MKKTLYSLMLSDEVVAEVDRLAHRLGTNRSNLINQILAEHVNLVTPERRINDIFSAIEQLMTPSRELVPFVSPNALTMSLKSSLEYKYRPTVKYEVELYRGSKSDLACQILADTFGLPVKRIHTHEACSLGAAMVAFVAKGEFNSFDEAIKSMVHEKDVFTPDQKNHETYMNMYNKVYRKIYKNVRPLYATMNNLKERNMI